MSFVEFCTEYKIKKKLEGEHHHCRPGWIQLEYCPFCGSENFHLGYNLHSHFMHCWRCGSHSFLSYMHKIGKSTHEVFNIEKEFNLKRSKYREKEYEKKSQYLITPKIQPIGFLEENYLKKRGFNPKWVVDTFKIARCFGFPYTPEKTNKFPWENKNDTKWKKRIYIPVFVPGNFNPVTYTTRTISKNQKIKYLNAPSQCEKIAIKETLYGEHLILSKDVLIVNEGPIGVWNARQYGLPCVATYGSSVSSKQLHKMLDYDHIFIFPDNDFPGRTFASKLFETLSLFGKKVDIITESQITNYPYGANEKDLGSINEEEAKNLIKHIRNLLIVAGKPHIARKIGFEVF